MRSKWLVLGCLVLLLPACSATPGPESAASVLPLKKVRLYETGVGYFERSGTIAAESDQLPVPASHVDDALKTMIVMAKGGQASVAGIEFESVVSRGLARSLAALPLESERPVTYRDVLESLKGVEVELEGAQGKVAGKLVEVTKAPPIPIETPDDDGDGPDAKKKKPRFVADTEDDLYVTVLTDTGAVRRFRASRLESVRPTDPNLSARLGSAVGALSGRAAQIQRSLRVLAAGSAPVRLGYIAETPVWRSTYRLVLGDKGDRASIQGWALVHNDTDERWSGIQVELVNGRPDSFLFPLSAPRYTRRPLAEPAEIMSTVPQLADKTADQIWGDHVETGGYGTGQGFGSGHGRLGRSHRTRAPRVRMGSTSVSTRESDEISIGNLAEVAQATGTETGALFSYTLANALDLRAHGSALVPFTQQKVEARRLTWFAVADEQGRSAARFLNTTTQTLPSGPVAVYEPSGFAGETGMGRLKPRERAFLRFGIDLDVELGLEKSKSKDTLKKVRYVDGRLREHFIRHHDREYELTNRSGSPRFAYLVLDIVKNAKVEGVDETDFDQEDKKALAVFRLPANSKKKRSVAIDEALERSTDLGSLTSEKLKELVESAEITAHERKVLEAAAALIEAAEKKRKEKSDAEREIERLKEDLERVREHLQALGDKSGSPAGANPLVTRILELEDELSKLRRQVERLAEERKGRLDVVAKELEKLNDAAVEAAAQPPPPAAQP